jgi:hypothetical protein
LCCVSSCPYISFSVGCLDMSLHWHFMSCSIYLEEEYEKNPFFTALSPEPSRMLDFSIPLFFWENRGGGL